VQKKRGRDATYLKTALPHTLSQFPGLSPQSHRLQAPGYRRVSLYHSSPYRIPRCLYLLRRVLDALTSDLLRISYSAPSMRHWSSVGHRRICRFRHQSFYYRQSVKLHPTHRNLSSGGGKLVEEDIRFWKHRVNTHHQPTTTTSTTSLHLLH
jgi:hypothetical protein